MYATQSDPLKNALWYFSLCSQDADSTQAAFVWFILQSTRKHDGYVAIHTLDGSKVSNLENYNQSTKLNVQEVMIHFDKSLDTT